MPAYKDKKRNTWYVKYSVKVDGKPKQVLKRGFATKRDAQQYESRTRYSASASGMTFRELMQRYLDYKKPKESTTELYERLLALHFSQTPSDIF